MEIRLFCCVGWALWRPSDDMVLCLLHADSDGAGRKVDIVRRMRYLAGFPSMVMPEYSS